MLVFQNSFLLFENIFKVPKIDFGVLNRELDFEQKWSLFSDQFFPTRDVICSNCEHCPCINWFCQYVILLQYISKTCQ